SAELGCDLDVADLPPGVAVGDALQVAVRPERIFVTAGRPEGSPENVLRARIKDVAFLGNQSRLACELPSGKLLTAVRLNPGDAGNPRARAGKRDDEPRALEPGANVHLVFAARDCRGLKA